MADPITLGIMSAAGTALSAAGTIAGGNAAAAAGRASQQAYEFKAKQEEMQAQESRAAAQRLALDKQRETRIVQSSLQARAAASGGGADDPTVVGLGREVAGRGEYQSLLETYKGENRARGLDDQAVASRMSGQAALAEGQAKQRASYLAAAGTIVGAAPSVFSKYR